MTCAVPAGSYASFSARLHDEALRRRLPLNATIELTRRCPLRCLHCYNNLPMADASARRQELTADEHRLLLDQIADLGCLWLLVTGGEPLARQDFLEIYTHAKRAGFIVTLFTNATQVTARLADALGEWRPFEIEVTLYGRTRETYERLTGVAGSYERCLAGIRLLQERGLPLALKTVAVRTNRHEIPDIKRFVEEELGLPFRFDAEVNPRIDCSHRPLEVRLSPEEIVALDLDDAGRMAAWDSFARGFIRPQQPCGHERDLYQCGAGLAAFAVGPTGLMTLCTMAQREGFDLRQGSVREGWERFLASVRSSQITRVTKCSACQLKSMCGMCPANAELEAGDAETPVEFLCHLAHLRGFVFGWPMPPHGSCEYCPGGVRHAELVASAERLKRQAAGRGGDSKGGIQPGAPRLELACAPSGCSSCGRV